MVSSLESATGTGPSSWGSSGSSSAADAGAHEGFAVAHEGHHPIRVEAPKGLKAITVDPSKRRWLAGDHHVHSRYSVSYTASPDGKSPPTPVIAGDAIHPIPTNAAMGAKFGLSWMVATDHGGRGITALGQHPGHVLQ